MKAVAGFFRSWKRWWCWVFGVMLGAVVRSGWLSVWVVVAFMFFFVFFLSSGGLVKIEVKLITLPPFNFVSCVNLTYSSRRTGVDGGVGVVR